MTPGAPTPRWGALAGVLLPPIVVLLLRAVLQAQGDGALAGLQALQPATQVATPGEAMWAAARPFVLTLVAVAVPLTALWLGVRRAVRRYGWPRVRPWLLRGWWVLCLMAAAGLLTSHLNRTGRQPQPPQQAKVLLVRGVPPSARGVGGAELYLQLPGQAEPQHLLAEALPAAAFAAGSAVELRVESGRWWGRWARVVPPDAGAGRGG